MNNRPSLVPLLIASGLTSGLAAQAILSQHRARVRMRDLAPEERREAFDVPKNDSVAMRREIAGDGPKSKFFT